MAPQANHHHPQLEHHHQQPQPQTQSSSSSRPQKQDKDRISVLAIPSRTIVDAQVVYGDASSMSERSYTPVKGVGDGSFGTVWLCDWHTPLPSSIQLAPMQQGAGAKPEWQGKRLVAIKRMKKRWDGGWDDCRKHPELESLRSIPPHENVIPLYDCFLLPSTKELYFVFECMEGNLYQLIKSRKGRPLAGGLVSSIFRQTCLGLAHIHDAGYFHRDMKPENLLVTTTGLTDYTPVSPLAPPGAPPEKDVVVIIKLADFGLARMIKSKPPYTEYVSTRWYRAPEVLLQSTDYNAPVDLWALGTIMAEVVNLKPLFPGTNGHDQLYRICQVLGDPSDVYGFDSHGRPRGGGKWSRGIKMAKQVGIQFEKVQPLDFFSLFDPSVPHSLIDCIHLLLRYDPDARLTAHECLSHVYFEETLPKVQYPPLNMPRRHLSSAGSGNSQSSRNSSAVLNAMSPRSIPPSHSHSASASRLHHHQLHHHPQSQQLSSTQQQHAHPHHHQHINHHSHLHHPYPRQTPHLVNGDMDMSPADGVVEVDRYNNPIRQYSSTQPARHPAGAAGHDRMVIDSDQQQMQQQPQGKSGMLSFGKKLGSMFKHEENKPAISLPPVEEITYASRSTPSLKDTPSTSAESRSLPEVSTNPAFLAMQQQQQQAIPPPVPVPPPTLPPLDPKKLKKEQERLEREKRANQERMQRERSRAVMAKRSQAIKSRNADFEYQSVTPGRLAMGNPARNVKPKVSKEETTAFGNGVVPASVVAAQSFGATNTTLNVNGANTGRQARLQPSNSVMPLLGGSYEYRTKRRKEDDDDQSMSSSDVQSIGRMSVISFATVDSDPGPGRSLRKRRSAYSYGLSPRPDGTATSLSSLQSFTNSPRSSHSVEPSLISGAGSIDAQFVSDFEARATFAAAHGAPLYSPAGLHPGTLHVANANSPAHSDVPDSMSPPNLQFLTLAGSPSQAPWTLDSPGGSTNGDVDGNSVSTLGSRKMPGGMVSLHGVSPGHRASPSFEYFSHHARSHPPTPHSGSGPAFFVVPPVPPLPTTSHLPGTNSLPPFSTLAAVSDMGSPQPQALDTTPHSLDHPP
ncbi:Pkinase-domain-containing protein [Serendipita vermifera]|nr:Pkinase-domain-containing protein [Serendipita vermifera]